MRHLNLLLVVFFALLSPTTSAISFNQYQSLINSEKQDKIALANGYLMGIADTVLFSNLVAELYTGEKLFCFPQNKTINSNDIKNIVTQTQIQMKKAGKNSEKMQLAHLTMIGLGQIYTCNGDEQ